MRMRKLLAATALGTSLALGGAAFAGSTADKTTTPSAGRGAAATITGSHWYDSLTADQLAGKDVHNTTGEAVGEIEKVVRDTDGAPHAVVSVGGFLGIGDKNVLIPLSRMSMADDTVVLLSAEDEAQLKQLPAYDETVQGYTEVPGDQRVAM